MKIVTNSVNYLAKEASSKAEAIKMMHDHNLTPYYNDALDCQKWRDKRYWNEEIDNLLKSHFPLFQYMFKNYGCGYLKPGEKPFMMVDEFQRLITTTGLISNTFVERDIFICFHLLNYI